MTIKGYIMSKQNSLFGHTDAIGFGYPNWHVREIPKEVSKQLIIKNHYSHKVCNDATTHIHLGLFVNEILMGALQFGYAMNPQSMSSVVKDTKLNGYKELNRMWFDDKLGKNTESRAISYSIKYIKKKFPSVKWIQSFADERCGKWGIVYQAANFDFYGEHSATFWEFEGEIYHNSLITNNNRNKKKSLEAKGFSDKAIKYDLRQFRYIYFIDKRERRNCLLNKQPYLKHYEND
jgi:hypothetical protein